MIYQYFLFPSWASDPYLSQSCILKIKSNQKINKDYKNTCWKHINSPKCCSYLKKCTYSNPINPEKFPQAIEAQLYQNSFQHLPDNDAKTLGVRIVFSIHNTYLLNQDLVDLEASDSTNPANSTNPISTPTINLSRFDK